jgi:hypothetical protein
VPLIVLGGLQDAATIDMAEELVPSSIHELLFTQTFLPLSFGRARTRLAKLRVSQVASAT